VTFHAIRYTQYALPEPASQTEPAADQRQPSNAADGGLISVMPETLANKIAAGEVVQRPASVAKELLENALDAGAEDVELIVKKAGRALVQVVDDGCGMGPADAERCFQRHATSKVRAAGDLQRIQTLGFRGEALASIGAVAQVDLKTKRPSDATGMRVRIEGGEQTEAAPCATPPGTSVAVRNLFFNVPARRSFLKTDATEFKHLVETFQQQALAHPGVAFRLVHNDNEVYRVAQAEGDFFEALRRRIGDLLGEDRAEELRRVSDEASYLSVRGVAGAPGQSRRSRREQFLFVNGRYVENRYLAHAVKAAYGALLDDGDFPFFALFLSLDPARVDVNVHPTKAEVKFEDKSGVYGLLRSAVREALSEGELDAPQFEGGRFPSTDVDDTGFSRADFSGADDEAAGPSGNAAGARGTPPRADFGESRTGASGDRDAAPRSQRQSGPAPGRTSSDASAGDLSARLYAPLEEGDEDDAGEANGAPDASGQAASGEAASGEAASGEPPSDEPPCWPVGGRFVAVPQEGRLLVIDAPAAHRRVLYERARRHVEDETDHPSQQVLFPETIELPAADVELFDDLLPDLRRMGFDLKRFSGRTVAVQGRPAGARGDAQALLEDVLDEYRTLGTARGDARSDRLAKSLARRGAVGPDAQLSPSEARALVRMLFRCEMPYADPAGQPTVLRLPPEKLAERFEEEG
jgi:DNA mismatch repair protein MutL